MIGTVIYIQPSRFLLLGGGGKEPTLLGFSFFKILSGIQSEGYMPDTPTLKDMRSIHYSEAHSINSSKGKCLGLKVSGRFQP